MSAEDFDDNRELCEDFVAESREMLGDVEPVLVELESGCAESGELDISQIDSIFRAFHSMKGSGGFLNLNNLVSVTHTAESLLDLFRKGQAQLGAGHITALCRAMDFINGLLDHIEAEYDDQGFEEGAAQIVAEIRVHMPSESGDKAEAAPGAAKADAAELAATPEESPTASGDDSNDDVAEQTDNDSDNSSDNSSDNNGDDEALVAEPGAAASIAAESADLEEELVSPEMLEVFVSEAVERMDAAEEALLAIERESDTEPLLDLAFRELHSLKGNCGFFGYPHMEALAHQAEDALDELRVGSAAPDPKIVSSLLRAIDVLRAAVQELPDGRGQISEPDRVLRSDDGPAAGASTGDAAPTAEAGEGEGAPEPQQIIVAIQKDAAKPAVTKLETAPKPEPEPKPEPKPKSSAKSDTASKRVSKAAIRVDLEKLDSLMDLVGELILAETMVTHNPDLEGHDFERFNKAALHLNRITRSLQDVAMSARMIPIGGTFRKMLRLVRDLGQKQNKKIDLQLVGEETEIDKTVVEAIADPLVHIIRNSVDHGIESAEVREERGKPATGRIRLEARHQGGEIWIIIEDDGGGLDREKILTKARDRGLIDPERVDLRDGEIFRCIFEAGFSTAAAVTDVSGRGVGMDVVRRNIDGLNGRVDVASELGAGTMITIRLPLTLAIIEGMLVQVGESIYTFPLLSIRESIPVEQEDITTLTGGQEMVHIRGRLLPMIRLADYHGIESGAQSLEDGIVIVVADDDPFCVWVDSIIGQRQTVIKALPDYLGGVKGVSGCSILSSGDISLILDMQAIRTENSDA